MGEKSKIEWLSGGDTWNPIRALNKLNKKRGWFCEKVSPECKFCYAERLNVGRFGNGSRYAIELRRMMDIYLDERVLVEPIRRKRPRLVFPCSMTDLYGDFVKREWLAKIYAAMCLSYQHTFLVLTKRPERRRKLLSDVDFKVEVANEVFNLSRITRVHTRPFQWPLPNVGEGVSCGTQKTADEWIPELLQTPAALRWLSAEPLLGPMNIVGALKELAVVDGVHQWPRLDWLVAGGESGPGARPMPTEWALSLRDQCKAAGVPFYFKQYSEWVDVGHPLFSQLPERPLCWIDSTGKVYKECPRDENADVLTMKRVGKKAAGRLLDGVEHSEYPELLQHTS